MPKRSHFKHRTEEEIAARTASGARSVHVLYIPENTEKAGAMGHLFSNGSSEKRTHHTSISPRDHGVKGGAMKDHRGVAAEGICPLKC